MLWQTAISVPIECSDLSSNSSSHERLVLGISHRLYARHRSQHDNAVHYSTSHLRPKVPERLPSSFYNSWWIPAKPASGFGIIPSTITPSITALVIYGEKPKKGYPVAFTIRDEFHPSSPPLPITPQTFLPLSSKTTSKASILSVNASLLSSNNFFPSSPSASRISNWLTRRETTVRSSMRASCLPMQP